MSWKFNLNFDSIWAGKNRFRPSSSGAGWFSEARPERKRESDAAAAISWLQWGWMIESNGRKTKWDERERRLAGDVMLRLEIYFFLLLLGFFLVLPTGGQLAETPVPSGTERGFYWFWVLSGDFSGLPPSMRWDDEADDWTGRTNKIGHWPASH